AQHPLRDHRQPVFFFQAEDGIRDRNVTGVQTCALPISPQPSHGGMTAMATIQKINGIKQTWHTIEFSNNHPPNNNPTKPAGPPSGSKKPTAHNTKPS